MENFKPLDPVKKIKDEPELRFTHNGQIKSALVRIADLKSEISDLKSEIEQLKQRLRLFEGRMK